MPKRKRIDQWSTATIVVTVALFAISIFEKGFTHELLLEAGVFLVSIKLILGSQKAQLQVDDLVERLDAIQGLLEKRDKEP